MLCFNMVSSCKANAQCCHQNQTRELGNNHQRKVEIKAIVFILYLLVAHQVVALWDRLLNLPSSHFNRGSFVWGMNAVFIGPSPLRVTSSRMRSPWRGETVLPPPRPRSVASLLPGRMWSGNGTCCSLPRGSSATPLSKNPKKHWRW